MDDNQTPDDTIVRFLKILVITLTTTMILGLAVIVGLFVMRFTQATTLPLPDQITLPDGATATAITHGQDWYAVVTTDNEILIFDRVTGQMTQTVTIKSE